MFMDKLNLTFFSNNSKTGLSYDFGICPLMKKVDGKYVSTCGLKDKCYTCHLIKTRPALLKKYEELDRIQERLNHVHVDIDFLAILNQYEPISIRAFGLFDYDSNYHHEFMQIVKKLHEKGIQHNIISKTIWINVLNGSFPMNDFILLCHSANISLGYTKQTARKFSDFILSLPDNQNLHFNINCTVMDNKELELIKIKHKGLYRMTNVIHDVRVHNFLRSKRNKDSFSERFKEYLDQYDQDDRLKICNIFNGSDHKIDCRECGGCDYHTCIRDGQVIKIDGGKI